MGPEPAHLQEKGPLMVRAAGLILAAALLALVGFLPAADDKPRGDDKDKPEAMPVAGNWKVYLQFTQRNTKPFFIVRLEEKDGKLTGSAGKAYDLQNLPAPTIDKIAVADG